MIPRPEPRTPDRDDLAKEVSFLPWKLLRGTGTKTADEVLELAKKEALQSASPKEISDATAKFAGEHETGLFQNPAGQWLFELSDKGADLTPEAMAYLRSNLTKEYGGDTGEMDLSRLLKHDILFDYVPGLKKVKTSIAQPYADQTDYEPAGGYSPPNTLSGAGTPAGRIQVFGDPGLPPDSTQRFGALNTLMHEVQHPLQFLYGLPQGGMPDDLEMQKFFKEQMRPQAEKIRIEAEKDRERFARDISPEDVPAGRSQWRRERPETQLLHEQSQFLAGAPGRTTSFGAPVAAKPPAGAHEQYESLAGEQSANRAAERMDWGTEQRRDNPSFMASGLDKLSPALQMLKFGPDNFVLPDLRWGLANTMLQR